MDGLVSAINGDTHCAMVVQSQNLVVDATIGDATVHVTRM